MYGTGRNSVRLVQKINREMVNTTWFRITEQKSDIDFSACSLNPLIDHAATHAVITQRSTFCPCIFNLLVERLHSLKAFIRYKLVLIVFFYRTPTGLHSLLVWVILVLFVVRLLNSWFYLFVYFCCLFALFFVVVQWMSMDSYIWKESWIFKGCLFALFYFLLKVSIYVVLNCVVLWFIQCL